MYRDQTIAKSTSLRQRFLNFNVHKQYPGELKINLPAASRDLGTLDLRSDPGICILTRAPSDSDSGGLQIHFEYHVSGVQIVTDINDKNVTIQIKYY